MAGTVTYASRLTKDESQSDMFRRRRKEGAEFWGPQWDDFARMQRFANQEHWPKETSADGSSNNPNNANANYVARAPRLTFDRISPIVQTASGRQIINRFERAYLPRHPSAARSAEIITAVDKALMQATDDEQVTSAAFKDGPIIQGVSCVRWEMDVLKEKGGGIIKRHLPMWQVMVDPDAREINYSDRTWHRYGEWMPQSAVKARWPDMYDELIGSIGGSSWAPDETHESSRIPWVGMAGNKPLNEYYPKGRCLWVEHEEWREVTTHWDVGKPLDPNSTYADALAAAMQAGPGSPDTITTEQIDDWATVREFKKEHDATFGEEVPKQFIVPKQQLVYKYAYICGNTVLETDDCPTGYWTYQFLTGFRYPQPTKTLFKSLVSRLIDPQKWINVFMSALIRNLQITPKGLLFVEDGFFKNRNEAMSAWGSPGGLIQVRRGALASGSKGYEHVSGGTSPYAGMLESLLELYKTLLPEIAGFNPGALGQLGGDLRRISGEVVRQVTDAAMTSNAEPFDSLRLYSREGGRITLSFLSRFFEVEDIVRIVGEDVAYETVMEPVPPQPVIDPATGQPATDPTTGQPVTQPAVDPTTGEQFMQVAMDPATGAPQRRLVVPDKGMWAPDAWKEIVVVDTAPGDDELQGLWKAIQTNPQIMSQPLPDTGKPIFSSEDLVETLPGIPAQVRERMLQRIKMAKVTAWRQSMQPQSQQAQAQPPGNTANGANSSNSSNGSNGATAQPTQ